MGSRTQLIKLNFIFMPKLNPSVITLTLDSFVEQLTDQERLNLLRALIDSYDCVTILALNDSISGQDIRSSKKFKNNLEIK